MEVFTSFVCIESQSLTLLLHCNTYHMKHHLMAITFFSCFWSSKYIFTFSFYRFLSSNTKQINLISDDSMMKHPLRKLRNTEIHRISWALVLLCKYVLCCLDKQWYDRFPHLLDSLQYTASYSQYCMTLYQGPQTYLNTSYICQLPVFTCKNLYMQFLLDQI